MLKIIVNKVNLKLGEISYSLYMNHYLIGANVLLLGLISKGFSKLSASLLTFIVIIIVSLSINVIVEKPALKYLRSRFKR